MSLQADLFVPEPPRTLTTEGRYGFGCDPSTKRLSVAWCFADGRRELDRGVRTCSYPAERDPARRLALMYAHTVTFAKELAERWPGVVWMEQPSSKFRNHPLSYAVGATMAGMYAGLWSVAEGRKMPEFDTVTPSAWKKESIGPGWHRLSKEEGGLVTAARALGYAGSLFDEADAWLIAEALRRTVRLTP